VWAGVVTNDTLEPLRSRIRAGDDKKHGGRPDRIRRAGLLFASRSTDGATRLPGSEGRWSLRAARWDAQPNETERRAALARALLDRYGVVTREVAHAEGIAGGFSAVYDVLKAMEDAGRVRRGYFLEGRGGAQFALPGADERVRALRDSSEDDARTLVLAATDPANPYGAALEWPASSSAARPQRAAGALVVLSDGALVGWVGKTEHALLTFLPSDEPERSRAAHALASALASLAASPRRRAVLITTIDGDDASKSAVAEHLARAGFSKSSRGLQRRAPREDEKDEKPPALLRDARRS
jgi:ATP-dependent Lhr-like helicase